jgi:hypothetical protein
MRDYSLMTRGCMSCRPRSSSWARVSIYALKFTSNRFNRRFINCRSTRNSCRVLPKIIYSASTSSWTILRIGSRTVAASLSISETGITPITISLAVLISCWALVAARCPNTRNHIKRAVRVKPTILSHTSWAKYLNRCIANHQIRGLRRKSFRQILSSSEQPRHRLTWFGLKICRIRDTRTWPLRCSFVRW